MSDTIVVGVDGSATAWRAACSAHDLAAALNATLHVVCVFDGERAMIHQSDSDLVTISDAAAAEHLARIIAEAVRTDIFVTYTATRGNPAEAILAEATRVNASASVLGNRRTKGISRALGRVVNTVAHHARCYVYIAYRQANSRPSPPSTALSSFEEWTSFLPYLLRTGPQSY